jgi:hypothetical protein
LRKHHQFECSKQSKLLDKATDFSPLQQLLKEKKSFDLRKKCGTDYHQTLR